MKLLLCCENYRPSVGGVQEVMRQVAERLVAAGHSVTVVTSPHPLRAVETVIEGVTVLSFPIRGNLVKGMSGPVESYRRFVLETPFDAILIKAAQQWTFDALTPVLGAIRARKVFIPCGFSALYRPAFKDYFARMPAWLAAFDSLIFYAGDYRDIRFARENGLGNIVVLPNGADEREFSGEEAPGFRARHEIGKADALILTVGSLNGAKGHWELAQAFELAHFERPATLILNGNMPRLSLIGRLRQTARAVRNRQMPGLARLVARINRRGPGLKRIILADLPRPELVEAYKAADLFAFASHLEYSPLVLFEAVAAGTPFLSTPVGNAAEIARWTGAGTICNCAADSTGQVRPDPRRLARRMEDMLRSPEVLKAFGERGRHAFVEGGFSWASIVRHYEAVLAGRTEEADWRA